jgi:hypothetical protein
MIQVKKERPMQISDSNFAAFVATMATVLEDIELRQPAKLQQAGCPATPTPQNRQPRASRQAPPLASRGHPAGARKVA